LPRPVNAFERVIRQKAGLPEPDKHTHLHPLLETIVGGAAGADACGVEGIPLAAGSQNEENPVQTLSVIRPRPPAAKPMRVYVFGQQRLNLGP